LLQHYRVAGVSFQHMHMGDNLQMVAQHPQCQLVAICDQQPQLMTDAIANLGLNNSQVFTDWQRCIEDSRPDFIVLCPCTGDHALWIERLAPYGLPILMEKPMAASLQDADRMIDACRQHDVVLAINWPLVWVPSHRTAKRLVESQAIGQLVEVHYYNGNRGPLWHTAHKKEVSQEEVQQQKPHSWFYSRQHGGGSLLDYLGYGTTLGTWFLDGQKPLEVTCVVDQSAEHDVNEHSVTVARYDFGLSKFETRWGTFTDPWVHQPQPRCGFVLVGTDGTICSDDYANTVLLQTHKHPEGIELPVDHVQAPHRNPIEYFVHCLEHRLPIEGPLSLAISRIGQQIVDTAIASAQQRRTVPLLP
jgi:predicted dehydrogenase